jgi:competence ComEA-like helix-hairpin-helix protein
LRKAIIIIFLILSIGASFFLFLHNKDEPRINVNSASIEALESLPGVGKVLAVRIIQDRPFKTIEELDRVKGIGPKTIEKIIDKAVAE